MYNTFTMTDDYTSTRASGSSVCKRRSRQFTVAQMNADSASPEKFKRKYGISVDTFIELRRTNKLQNFTEGHDTCPRQMYISKITPRSDNTRSYVTAWADSKTRYAEAKGLYSGDIECRVCKERVTSGGYCKETACMGGMCWKHLSAKHKVRILNADTLLGKPLYTTSENGRLPQFNGVYYSPDNEILVPALYAWDLKSHLKVMEIMNTPVVHNIKLMKKFLRLVFPTSTAGVYPFLVVLYNSNKKIFHTASMSLISNADKYKKDPVPELSKLVSAFFSLSEGSRDMRFQLLFYVLFQYALTLDSAKSMALYGFFMRVLTDANPEIAIAGKNGTVAKYISGSSFDLDDVSLPKRLGERFFEFDIIDKFNETCNTVSRDQLVAEFEAVDVDLVNPDRIPYIYQSGNLLLDCRTKRVLANYILPYPNDHGTRVVFQGADVRIDTAAAYIHGMTIESGDVPDWYTLTAGQPMVILQRTYRTFYTDKKRGSVSNLIVNRLRKDSSKKANTTNNNRGSDRARFKTMTTSEGHYRA